MSMAQEIKDFVAAFTGVSKVLGTPEDRAYKKLRNQIMQFKLQQAQHNMNIKNQLLQQQSAARQEAQAQSERRVNDISGLGAKRGTGPTPLDPSGSPSGSLAPSEVGDPSDRPSRGPSLQDWTLNPNSNANFDNQLPTSVDTGGGEEALPPPTDDPYRDMGAGDSGEDTDYAAIPTDDSTG